MFKPRRILCTIAALLMIAGAAALFMYAMRDDPNATGSGGGDAKYMFLDRVGVGLRVDPAGRMSVTEKIQYDLGSDAWHGLYQDIILKHGERVGGVSVARVSGGSESALGPGSGIVLGVGGAYGTYGWGMIDNPRRLRIVWNVNDTGINEFVVRYRLRGAVENHRDAATLLWDAWGSGWETGVGRLDVGVVFPGELKLLQPRTDGLQSRVSGPRLRGRRGSFTVTRLPAKQTVQLRAAAAPLTRMPRDEEVVMPAIEKEVARIDADNADRAKRSARLHGRGYAFYLLIALAGALLGVLAVFVIYLVAGRDRSKPIAAGGVYHYPPEKIPAPVIAKALGGAKTENLVSATLLSMLQRDVFRVIPSATKKEDIGIMNNVGETSFDATRLARWEVPIAKLLQSAINDHPQRAPDFSKLKKHLTPSEAETKIASFGKAIDAEMKKLGLTRTYRGLLRRTILCAIGAALFLLAAIAAIGTGANDAAARWDAAAWALPMFGFASVVFWAAIEGDAVYHLKPEQEQRVRAWETYQDFFRQMDLSREYPLTVEIWDEALVYAAAFGFAKKVITNMPRTAPDGTRDLSDTTSMGIFANNAFAASAIGNMTSGIGAVTGMSTSSSSGGGGFSGGASGGGGGGGW